MPPVMSRRDHCPVSALQENIFSEDAHDRKYFLPACRLIFALALLSEQEEGLG